MEKRLVFKFIPSLLLAFAMSISSGVQADWVKVDSYDAGTYYINSDEVKKSGYMRSFWSVLDYKLPQKTSRGLAYQSTRTHMEIDIAKANSKLGINLKTNLSSIMTPL